MISRMPFEPVFEGFLSCPTFDLKNVQSIHQNYIFVLKKCEKAFGLGRIMHIYILGQFTFKWRHLWVAKIRHISRRRMKILTGLNPTTIKIDEEMPSTMWMWQIEILWWIRFCSFRTLCSFVRHFSPVYYLRYNPVRPKWIVTTTKNVLTYAFYDRCSIMSYINLILPI